MLRFAGGLHIVSGRIVIEADLDHGGAVRRLHHALKDLFAMESELVVVRGGSLHRGSRYVLRVTEYAEVEGILARLRESGAEIDEMQLQQADLEDIFIQIMDSGSAR